VSAQPVDVDRFPQLAEIERQRAEALARRAGPDPRAAASEPIVDTRFTVTYRKDGEEHTVDLDEVPDEELPESARRWRPAQKYAVIEDIRFMAGQGETLAGVAERLTNLRGRPISAESVERFLHRYGAHELVWQLKAAEDGDPAPDSPDWYLAHTVGDCRPALSPEEAEAARRRWIKGPQDSGVSYGAAMSATVRSPFARASRGHTLRGRKL
jgi:hypothetical protein